MSDDVMNIAVNRAMEPIANAVMQAAAILREHGIKLTRIEAECSLGLSWINGAVIATPQSDVRVILIPRRK